MVIGGTRAVNDYAGNGGIYTSTGAMWGDGKTGGVLVRRKQSIELTLADIKDGSSHSILVGEKRLDTDAIGTFQCDDNEGHTSGWDWDIIRWGNDPPLARSQSRGPMRVAIRFRPPRRHAVRDVRPVPRLGRLRRPFTTRTGCPLGPDGLAGTPRCPSPVFRPAASDRCKACRHRSRCPTAAGRPGRRCPVPPPPDRRAGPSDTWSRIRRSSPTGRRQTVYVPGQGFNARTWLRIRSAGRVQSTCPSDFCSRGAQ